MTDPRTPSIGDLIARRPSRRAALKGSATTAAGVFVGGGLLAACSSNDGATSADNPLPTVTITASPTTVTSGNRVTITATATDNGSVASTAFTQVGGPAVNLSATTGLTTSFVAPATTGPTTIVIRLTATDNQGATGSNDVNVTLNPPVLGFAAVAKNRNDLVTLPAGYQLAVVYRTGDPLNGTVPAYQNTGADTDFASRAGDNHAGFYYFGLVATGTGIDVSNSARGLLAMNHEGITQAYLHPNGPTNAGGVRPEAEVVKEVEAHGISVVEMAAAATTGFAAVPASALNRRVTPNTTVAINGPVRGNALMQTAFSTDGTQGRGTIGNSSLFSTGWSTALSAEEKWARYFRRPAAADDARRSAKELVSLRRYGITGDAGLYGWSTVTANPLYRRWDAQASGASAQADFRNEPNQFGWVVEVDPYNRDAPVRKRTALGRMAHSALVPAAFVVGVRPVVYMGDAGEGEYLYKFVSNTVWASADANPTDRMAIGDKYLDTGTLFVARFADDGTGTWLPLTFGTAPITAANAAYAFTDQADVLANARLAGDAQAATPMDRPAWMDVNRTTGEVFVALNGNDARRPGATNAANPRAYVDPPSAQVGNRNGHILRIREASTAESTTFSWDVHVFASGADLDATNINVSTLTDVNDFSGPETLRFGRPSNPSGLGLPLLFIGTDDTAFRDATNNQMLVGFAGGVGDNGTATAKTISNGGSNQVTRLGLPRTADRLRRFLVGPNGAAITGADTTPDGRVLFVNIQHPGEGGTAAAPTSNWPANQSAAAPGTRPRSATIAITRTDGGIIGL